MTKVVALVGLGVNASNKTVTILMLFRCLDHTQPYKIDQVRFDWAEHMK